MYGNCQLHGDQGRFFKLERFKDDLKPSGSSEAAITEDLVPDNLITRNNLFAAGLFLSSAKNYISNVTIANIKSIV